MLQSYQLSTFDQKYLAYLRGFAILTIVFGHVGGYWAIDPYSSYLHASGSTFFFFLSGPILCHNYFKAQSISHFYIKRYANLLIPYYLICLLSLFYYFTLFGRMPEIEISNVLRWITINPSNDIMPFPLGQLWFLHVYIMLFLFSPLIFYLYKNNFQIIKAIFFLSILFSFVPFFLKKKISFYLLGFNLLDGFFFLSFFILGIWSFDKERKISKFIILYLPILLFFLMNRNYNVSSSFENRDIVACLVTYSFIGFVYTFKKYIFCVLDFKIIKNILNFCHKHTFSIYLTHTFLILVSEKYFGLDGSGGRTIFYGINKFLVVIVFTCMVSYFFTLISKRVVRTLLDFRFNS